MTDKKQPSKRRVAYKRHYDANRDMVASTPGMTGQQTIDELQAAIKDAWFEEAQK
jgi:hypothetical protein